MALAEKLPRTLVKVHSFHEREKEKGMTSEDKFAECQASLRKQIISEFGLPKDMPKEDIFAYLQSKIDEFDQAEEKELSRQGMTFRSKEESEKLFQKIRSHDA